MALTYSSLWKLSYCFWESQYKDQEKHGLQNQVWQWLCELQYLSQCLGDTVSSHMQWGNAYWKTLWWILNNTMNFSSSKPGDFVGDMASWNSPAFAIPSYIKGWFSWISSCFSSTTSICKEQWAPDWQSRNLDSNYKWIASGGILWSHEWLSLKLSLEEAISSQELLKSHYCHRENNKIAKNVTYRFNPVPRRTPVPFPAGRSAEDSQNPM